MTTAVTTNAATSSDEQEGLRVLVPVVVLVVEV
jgi:hypothetical protein